MGQSLDRFVLLCLNSGDKTQEMVQAWGSALERWQSTSNRFGLQKIERCVLSSYPWDIIGTHDFFKLASLLLEEVQENCAAAWAWFEHYFKTPVTDTLKPSTWKRVVATFLRFIELVLQGGAEHLCPPPASVQLSFMCTLNCSRTADVMNQYCTQRTEPFQIDSLVCESLIPTMAEISAAQSTVSHATNLASMFPVECASAIFDCELADLSAIPKADWQSKNRHPQHVHRLQTKPGHQIS